MSSAPQAAFALHALAFALPSGNEPPEWIDIFPASGAVKTRDGRRFNVDPKALAARFAADGVKIPIDVNHATHHAALSGGRADPVGWIVEMRVSDKGALQGKVEWLVEGAQLHAEKKYPFVSPDFFHTADGVPTWVRSVAIVSAPALGNQAALAAASDHKKEATMKELASALGVTDAANEQSMLAALGKDFVPKAVHDETLAKLAEKSARLTAIETEGRKAEVDALLDGAVNGKKILPADRERYAALCASDDGLGHVRALLAAQKTILPASGLDAKKTPESEAPATAAQLAAEAKKLVEGGEASNIADAMELVERKRAAA